MISDAGLIKHYLDPVDTCGGGGLKHAKHDSVDATTVLDNKAGYSVLKEVIKKTATHKAFMKALVIARLPPLCPLDCRTNLFVLGLATSGAFRKLMACSQIGLKFSEYCND